MPSRGEPLIAVTVATRNGARKARGAAGQRIDAEIAAGLVGGDAARQIGARRGLHRAEGDADQQAEERCRPFPPRVPNSPPRIGAGQLQQRRTA